MATLQDSPVSLAEALSVLGKVVAYGLHAAAEPAVDDVPGWLVHTLVNVVKVPRREVARLTPAQAQQIWDAYISSPQDWQHCLPLDRSERPEGTRTSWPGSHLLATAASIVREHRSLGACPFPRFPA